MELKPVIDNYEKPECPTEKEVKLNLWALLGRGGKISLGAAIVFLVCIQAVNFIDDIINVGGSVVISDIPVKSTNENMVLEPKNVEVNRREDFKEMSSFQQYVEQDNSVGIKEVNNVNIMGVFRVTALLGFLTFLILTVIFIIRNYRRYKRGEKLDVKNRKANKIIIIGIVVVFLLWLSIWF